MEPIILKDRRKSPRVPVELTILGEVEGRRLAMCSSNISIDGMFLNSRGFVRPHAVFPAKIWLANEEEPLKTYMTASFIESTWNGYGIGVHISGISSEDSVRWESFYRTCAPVHAPGMSEFAHAEPPAEKGHILAVGSAIHPLAMQAMRKQGLQVSYVPSVDEAIELLRRETIAVVISDLRCPGLDGLALCCHVKSHRLPTHTVLLTSSSTPKEFLLGLYAGASRVICKPSGNDLLVSRIRELLRQPLPAGSVKLPGDFALRPTDKAITPLFSAENARVLSASASSSGHIAARVSQRMSQACHYISDRLSGRQVA